MVEAYTIFSICLITIDKGCIELKIGEMALEWTPTWIWYSMSYVAEFGMYQKANVTDRHMKKDLSTSIHNSSPPYNANKSFAFY